ncbi:hypothetical protein [Saccharopolyspora spinosa]|uniref:Uncharacterized protein n=1 Tax=Saccharopolyspora spinosa TaxID=60894 RepID=A0A2N3Y6Y5_SACSN|nr:hypothetical protein [Saccharopolyspora spinosa]PKW18638.1 hypothetical protein A8926_6748 [Saccharopolyspora spinosa]
MTEENHEQPEQPEPSNWVAIITGEPTLDDARLLAFATASATDGVPARDEKNPPGDAVFVMLTQRYPGADRELLENISDAWFVHSGLYPALATFDLEATTVTFFKAVSVRDFHHAERITWEGIRRALEAVELGKVVPVDGYVADVSRERDWWPKEDGK